MARHAAEERRQLGVVRPSHHEEATQHTSLNFTAYEAPVLPSQRAASAALGAPPPSGVSLAFPGKRLQRRDFPHYCVMRGEFAA